MSNTTPTPTDSYSREWAVVKLDDLYSTVQSAKQTVDYEYARACRGRPAISTTRRGVAKLAKLRNRLREAYEVIETLYAEELCERSYHQRLKARFTDPEILHAADKWR